MLETALKIKPQSRAESPVTTMADTNRSRRNTPESVTTGRTAATATKLTQWPKQYGQLTRSPNHVLFLVIHCRTGLEIFVLVQVIAMVATATLRAMMLTTWSANPMGFHP